MLNNKGRTFWYIYMMTFDQNKTNSSNSPIYLMSGLVRIKIYRENLIKKINV